MEIDQAWALNVDMEEIKRNGTVLNKEYKVKFDKSEVKIHTLYYLNSKDLFVTVENQYKGIQVVSDLVRIRSFREQYLGQMNVDSTDQFTEMDTTDYHMFKPEVDLTSIESVRKHGRFLGKKESGGEIYYIEKLDAFAVDEPRKDMFTLFQDSELRKKFNIPYQDERFETLPFN